MRKNRGTGLLACLSFFRSLAEADMSDIKRLARLTTLVMIPLGLFAARLTLLDGTVISGRFGSGSTQNIIFQDDRGVRRTYRVNQVQSIDFNTLGAATVDATSNDASRLDDDYRIYSGDSYRANASGDYRATASDDYRASTNQSSADRYNERPGYRDSATLSPGTDISVRTGETIDSQDFTEPHIYRAS